MVFLVLGLVLFLLCVLLVFLTLIFASYFLPKCITFLYDLKTLQTKFVAEFFSHLSGSIVAFVAIDVGVSYVFSKICSTCFHFFPPKSSNCFSALVK
jgi:hypothetical protein